LITSSDVYLTEVYRNGITTSLMMLGFTGSVVSSPNNVC